MAFPSRDWTADQWKAFGEGCLYVLLSFAFFRVLQFIVRWYLFGKCTFRTFSYFAFRRRRSSERNAASDSTTLSASTRRRHSQENIPLPRRKIGFLDNRLACPKSRQAIPPNKKWRICNEAVSLIHAAVSGLWAGYSILFYPDLIKDMINYRHPVIVTLVLISAGYLAHDLADLLTNERSVRIIELLFHHIVVFTAFGITMISEKYLGVVVFGLLMELNSVFLHTRSLLNLYGVKKKAPSFRMVALLNMITLLVFRMAVSIYLFYWLVTVGFTESWFLIVPFFFVIVSLLVTNTVLAFRVMAADGVFGKKRARPNSGQTNEAAEAEEDKSSESDEDLPDEVAVVSPNDHSQQLVSNGGSNPA